MTDMAMESEFLLVLLGLQANSFTKEQVLECGAILARDRSRRLADILEEKGYLKKGIRAALEALVAEQVEKAGGNPGKCFSTLHVEDDLRGLIEEFLPPRPDDGTLLRWKGCEAGKDVRTEAGLKAAFESGAGTLVETPAMQPHGSSKLAGLSRTGTEKYEFGPELGRGGLGRVIEAMDTDLGREVAVKMMLPGLKSPAAVERFLLECRAAGKLSHPNIVPIHEIGVLALPGPGADGVERSLPYFTMTRIVGRDLGKILRALEHGFFEPDSPDAAPRQTDLPDIKDPCKQYTRHRLLRIFQDVCNAIAYAHDHGVIHRDLKPANIMVGNYGEVYVVDWGLAKIGRVPDSPDAASRKTDSPDNAAPTAGGEYFGIKHCPLVEEMEGVLGSNQENQSAPRLRQGDSEGLRRASLRAHQENQDTPALTLEGTVMGTPAYMPPEQAEGKISEIDARSDIYSLGAILYEMLTLRPPFEGRSMQEVLAKVLEGTVTPPSSRISETRVSAGICFDRALPGFEEVPPELDDVVLKALARDKQDRYSSARELHDEIQRFLEGEKQREYNRRMVLNMVSEGRNLVDCMEKAREEADALEKEVEDKKAETKPYWPVEKKKDLWGMEERVRNLRDKVARDFAAASHAFHAALEFERDNREARSAMADLYWARYLRGEAAGDRAETIQSEAVVREYNDGQYDARLEGDGTLEISTRAFPCRCLLDGRIVEPGEFGSSLECGVSSVERQEVAPSKHSTLDTLHGGVMGYHPMSGRVLAGFKGAEGLPDLEPDEPVFLRMHRSDCRAEPIEGADVWLFRYEDRDKILVPTLPSLPDSPDAAPRQTDLPDYARPRLIRPSTPPPVSPSSRVPFSPSTLPRSVLDRLYDAGSPFRPKEGLYLGKTPIAPFKLPMGSYLLIIAYRRKGSVEDRGSRVEKGERVKGEAWKGESKIPEESAGSSLYPLPSTLHPDAENEPDPSPSTLHPDAESEYAPVRMPVLIERCAAETVNVTLYREAEIPPGFVQVPAGRFIYQGDRENPYSGSREILHVEDGFIAKFPVTCAEYLEFLNDSAAKSARETAGRVPRTAHNAGLYWPCVPDQPRCSEAGASATDSGKSRYVIPTGQWIAEAPEHLRNLASKLKGSPVWWREDWPVFSVSWEDFMSYTAWRTGRELRLFTLPHEVLWEKSARGADGRLYVWGNKREDTFCNMNQSHENGMRPMPVDSFPTDESPYGVRGLGGNCRDLCINVPGEEKAAWRLCRGGDWAFSGIRLRATTRTGDSTFDIDYCFGGRIAWVPMCGTPK